MKLIIPGTLPTMNEMIQAAKKSPYAYMTMRDEAINSVVWGVRESIKRTKVIIPQPADFIITWYRPDKRTDKDNIMAGQKFIYDGLQEIGFMKNDGWSEINDITHRCRVDRKNPRTEIEIREVVA